MRGYLPACDPLDSLVMIASELAANAVTHTRSGTAGGRFIVDVTWCPEAARVAVGDQGSDEVPEIAASAEEEAAYAENGRGLLVVEALSSSWGMAGDAEARWLWADVDWRLSGAAVLVVPSANSDAELGLARLSCAYPGTLTWYDELSREWCALLPQPQGVGDALHAPTPTALSHMLATRYLAVS
jgi:serine/threonine-protein kinase RsbW